MSSLIIDELGSGEFVGGAFWCPFAHFCWFIRVGNGNMIWPMLGENRLLFHRVTGEGSGCPQILKRAHLICV